MARLCEKPPANRIAALIAQESDWTYDDAEAILEQGMPDCMLPHWEDPDAVYDFCAKMTNPSSDDDSDT